MKYDASSWLMSANAIAGNRCLARSPFLQKGAS